MSRRRRLARAAVLSTATSTALLLTAAPALAADPVVVTDQETVQAHLDASGKLKDARLYDQIALQGKGKLTIENPVSTRNLRNLDGFAGFTVKDGKIVQTVSVDGQKRLRSLSDYTKTLPLKVTPTYTLNGKVVKPGKVVGKAGTLEVRYKVENLTGTDQELTFDDGTGKMITKTESVVIPMVGQLTTLLPQSFTDIQSVDANMAGDGHGATKMSFTMTLFGPIGTPTAEFGYTAKIKDGSIPAVAVQVLPVSPLDSPTFKGAGSSYKGGADTGIQLTGGAQTIDDNLLKLRDGASTLLAGLIKLRDGASKLSTGLNGQAAPGAAKLADGAGKLKAGTSQLSSGANDAKAGAGKVAAGSDSLASGAGQLSNGSSDLAGGAADLADGISQILAGVNALPSTVAKDADFLKLKGALVSIQAGIGKATDTGSTTLLGGLNQLKFGLRSPFTPAGCDPNPSTPTACGAADGVEIIQGRLAAADPKLAGLTSAAVGAYKAAACPPPPVPVPVADVLPPSYLSAAPLVCQLTATLAYGLGLPPNMDPSNPDGGLKAQTALAASKLALIFQSIDGLMIPGINKLKLGLSNSSCNLANPQNPANPCGIKEAAGLVSGGIDQLVNSIANQLSGVLAQASSGAKQVADGAGQVAGGAGQVSSGAKQLAAGASQLNGGLRKLQDGAGQLDSGAGQLADGANQLSTGLKDASSGSTQLSDGLKEAAGKAPQIPNGATRLSQQGTSQLVKAGKGTAADFGEKYALIAAGAQRAKSEGMAYGAPANAAGATAYSLELAAADGEATRNWGRGVGALAIFAIAALGGAFLRRRFA